MRGGGLLQRSARPGDLAVELAVAHVYEGRRCCIGMRRLFADPKVSNELSVQKHALALVVILSLRPCHHPSIISANVGPHPSPRSHQGMSLPGPEPERGTQVVRAPLISAHLVSQQRSLRNHRFVSFDSTLRNGLGGYHIVPLNHCSWALPSGALCTEEEQFTGTWGFGPQHD
jgi:hypothetical protein